MRLVFQLVLLLEALAVVSATGRPQFHQRKDEVIQERATPTHKLRQVLAHDLRTKVKRDGCGATTSPGVCPQKYGYMCAYCGSGSDCTDTNTNVNNCGSCGVKCMAPNTKCVNGQCKP